MVFNLKLNFKLKKDQKYVLLKTWKKFSKPGKNFEKTSSNPVGFKKVLKEVIRSQNLF